MKSVLIAKSIRKNLKYLRKYTKNSKNSKSETAAWICDNFYTAEQSGKSAAEFFKRKFRLSDEIFDICKKEIQEQQNDREQDIEKLLINGLCSKSEWFDCQSLTALPAVLTALAIDLCKEGAQKNDPSKAAKGIELLAKLRSVDFETIISRFSASEKIFSADPGGYYLKMTAETRAYYRRVCADRAAKRGIREEQFAKTILEKAKNETDPRKRHIGYHLIERSEQKRRLYTLGWVFVAARAGLPFVISALIGILTGLWWIGWFIYIPIHELLRPFCEHFFARLSHPFFMPKIELYGHIPKAEQTLVAVPCLLPSPSGAKKLCEHMEELFSANENGHIGFCILADLKEAAGEKMPDDDARIKALKREVKKLGEKHGGRFFLIIRKRVLLKTQNAYAGWERKRGAVTELIRYIKTGRSQFIELLGDRKFLRECKNLLVLDSDTRLSFCAAADLVSAAAHPLNKPVVCRNKKIVTAGYGIIAPIVSTESAAACKNLFTRIMCGRGGINAYNSPCANAYQDMFAVTVFSGKGLINIDAFYECLNSSLPIERILSHDILEGSYLRCGLCTDVELLDGCPSSMAGFNSRQNRWIRGDFQNLLWLLPFITVGGEREKNNIFFLNKIFLSDNVTRALNSFTCLATIILSAFVPLPYMYFALGILGVISKELFEFLKAALTGSFSSLSQKYHCRVLTKTSYLILKSFFGITTLVTSAAVSLSGAASGLYRQLFSKKRLLEWTTAAEAERNSKTSLPSCIVQNAVSLIIGLLMIVFLPPLHKIVGGLFVLCPFAVYAFGKTGISTKYIPSPQTTERLTEYIAAMWKYFEQHCSEQNNYLPPDNIQKTPVFCIADRTSPTNIGFMMLSSLAACDLNIISKEDMTALLSNTLSSVERLEKYKGNLLNWYNIKTLEPLYPKYCSSVDSGNFAACLFALKNGLCEYEGTEQLVSRIESIIKSTDLGVFYDSKRHLFHIGIDIESGKRSSSYYDLLMSESRLLSYFAVTSGQVEKKHWGALSRSLGRQKGYCGPLSWSGTAFEYFMPSILLPAYKDTLTDEALSFCIFCQILEASRKKAPFGCSESGYYAFDQNLNYSYKAHGIPALGLKRGLERDYVVSPYSSFLMLPFIPEEALKNLKRLQGIGAVGQYGFYEAVDFTKSRIGKLPFAVVRSFMAHHIGMSICAAENLLKDNIMCKRFMRGTAKRAEILLYEKIPEGSDIYKSADGKDRLNIPEKARYFPAPAGPAFKSGSISPISPKGHLIFSGDLSLCAFDSGICSLKYGDYEIFRPTIDPLCDPQGIFAVVSVKGKGTDTGFSITAAPDYANSSSVRREAKAAADSIFFSSSAKAVSASLSLSLSALFPVFFADINVRNNGAIPLKTRVKVYFEPCLNLAGDFLSHPAFSRLFVRSRYDNDLNAAIFERNQRDAGRKLSIAAGLLSGKDFKHDFRREQVLSRPYGIFSLPKDSQRKISVSDNTIKASSTDIQERIPSTSDITENSSQNAPTDDGLPDCCFFADLEFDLPPFSKKSETLVITAAPDAYEAAGLLEKARRQKSFCRKRAVSPFDSSPVGIIGRQIISSYSLFYFGAPQKQYEQYDTGDLWALGISGDRPIVLAKAQGNSPAASLFPYTKLFDIFRLAKRPFDLCVLCGKKQRAAFKALSKDGIYIICPAEISEKSLKAVCSAAVFTSPESSSDLSTTFIDYAPVKISPVSPLVPSYKKELETPFGFFSSGRFIVTKKPPLPYCHILCTKHFGTLLSDCSLGYTYAFNSRECRLTPWSNDTSRDFYGEQLTVKMLGRYYDLINGSAAVFSDQRAVYFSSIKDTVFRTTVFVTDNFEKCISVDIISPKEKSLDISFCALPALGFDRRGCNKFFFKKSFRCITVYNPKNTSVKGLMRVSCSRDEKDCCVDFSDFLSGRWEFNDHEIKNQLCAALTVPVTLKKDKAENITFSLSFCPDNPHLKDSPIVFSNKFILKSSHPALDLMFNTWLPHQIFCSRIFGRTAFYQASGAYGFRDQLQDILAALYLSKSTARDHILLCCARQFEEGDVLHWWHESEKGPFGVRTRCSDDFLWLPLAVSKYITVTGEKDLLNQKAPFLTAAPLDPKEKDRYFSPNSTAEKFTVYEHCKRSFLRVKFSKRFLPLMGSCDWNDGFSGFSKGGESVWLAEFYVLAAKSFLPVCDIMGDRQLSEALKENIKRLYDSICTHCFEKDRYLRAFLPIENPIGSERSSEDKIDLLPQAFATLCGLPFTEYNKIALDTAYNRLFDRKNGIIRLFDPPFESIPVGYIADYPKGIRENGGQYTHGAVWLISALFKAGETERAAELLRAVLPSYKCTDKNLAEKYKVEPYALSADVYGGEHTAGRGGWTHYTGGAGWLYQVILEQLLGIKISGNKLTIHPQLPKDFGDFTLKILYESTDITFTRRHSKNGSTDSGTTTVLLDGKTHRTEI